MTGYTNRILKYLSGKMTPFEKEKFETDLRNNPQMKKEYHLTILAKDIFVGEKDLEAVLEDPNLSDAETLVNDWLAEDAADVEEQHNNKKERKNIRGNKKSYAIPAWIYLAAASVIIPFLIFKAIIIPHQAEKLLLEYYENVNRGEFISSNTLPEVYNEFQNGMNYFESKDYILALEIFDSIARIEGSHAQYASIYSGLCYIRLGDPRAALFYLAEVSGLSKHLQESTQKLIRRINLINTFQFKQYRKELSEDEPSNKMIGPTQRKIFIGIFLLVFILISLALTCIYKERIRNNKQLWWLPVIFLIPIVGSTIYLLRNRKK